MENTNNKTANEMYRIALDVNEQMYSLMEEIFKDNDKVTYCVELSRWNDRIDVHSYAALTYGCIISNELRELVGSESCTLNLNEYTEDGAAERYLAETEQVFRDYAHRAMLAKNIIDKKN